MEVSHGKLCTRLTYGLCGDYSDRLSHMYLSPRCHVCSITLRADTDLGSAGKYRTDLYRITAQLVEGSDNSLSLIHGAEMICLYNYILSIRIYDGLCHISSGDPFLKALNDLLAVGEALYLHAWDVVPVLGAVLFSDDEIL